MHRWTNISEGLHLHIHMMKEMNWIQIHYWRIKSNSYEFVWLGSRFLEWHELVFVILFLWPNELVSITEYWLINNIPKKWYYYNTLDVPRRHEFFLFFFSLLFMLWWILPDSPGLKQALLSETVSWIVEIPLHSSFYVKPKRRPP